MSQQFACPLCSAPLTYTDTSTATVFCPHCTNTVIVPAEVRRGTAAQPFDPFTVADPSRPTQVDTPGDTPAWLDEVAALVRSGSKIMAIKLYRERTNSSLKDAKDAVEAMEHGPAALPPALHSYDAPPPAAGLDRVRQALAAGSKIQAIKYYRELTGLGLKESKDAVEAMERGATPDAPSAPLVPPAPSGSGGCFSVVALIALALIAICWFLGA